MKKKKRCKRSPISKAHIVFPVQCAYCGISLTLLTHTWDHVVAKVNGGTDNQSNLVHCCSDCNHHKGAKTLQEFLAQPIPPPRQPRIRPFYHTPEQKEQIRNYKPQRTLDKKEYERQKELEISAILKEPWVIWADRCMYCKMKKQTCSDCSQ